MPSPAWTAADVARTEDIRNKLVPTTATVPDEPLAIVDRAVHICEVGLRDGLQLVRQVVPTDVKRRLAAALLDSGIAEIDATSFVPPHAFPQFADAAQIVAHVRHVSDSAGRNVLVGALAPNLKGAERAVEAGAGALYSIVSVSRSHNLANVRRTIEQQAAITADIKALIDRHPVGSRPRLIAALPTAFGCSLEGRVPVADVCRVAVMMSEIGADEITLADTVGYADPRLIKVVVKAVRDAVGRDMPLRLHLHDTMGLGLANVLAGLEVGITRFDASAGGLGGCPFAPGASGNIATEDLVFMLEQMGLRTGIDLGKLLQATDLLAQSLPEERIRSHVHEAGVPKIYGVAS
jgi:hydroxymethylglutaryl-CoA lyase